MFCQLLCLHFVFIMICHYFLPPSRRSAMSCQIMYLPNIHPIYLQRVPASCVAELFSQLPQLHCVMDPYPHQVISHQIIGRSKGHRNHSNIAPSIAITYVFTSVLHTFLYFMHCHVASAIIILLPKAVFPTSI